MNLRTISSLLIVSFLLLAPTPRSQVSTGWVKLNLDPTKGPPPRHHFAMAYDPLRDRVVLFGGGHWNSQGKLLARLNDTWEFDGTKWTKMSPLTSPSPRYHVTMVYYPPHKSLLLFGGNDGTSCGSAETWEWDGKTWKKLALSSSPSGRWAYAMALDPVRKRILLQGGYLGCRWPRFQNDFWEFAGTKWVKIAGSFTDHAHELAFDPISKKFFLFGGYNGSSSLRNTYSWDGTRLRLLSTTTPNNVTHLTSLVRSSSKLYLAFGWTGSGVVGDLLEWKGNRWVVREKYVPNVTPIPRYSENLFVWDTKRNRGVLFGGRSGWPRGNDLNDTWVWYPPEDPAREWRWITDSGSLPAGRYGAAVAGGAKERLLFGGVDGKGTVLGDTWIHDGAKWTQLKPAKSPAARMRGRLAFDGKRFVLFGGRASGGSLLGDTWTFDPVKKTWTQIFPSVSPPARAGHILEWDPVSKKVLLFGGQGASGLLNDTWGFSGNTWTKLGPTASPSVRTLAASCTDPKAKTVVLIGGRTSSGALADHWTWNGTTWSRVSSSILPGARAGAGLVYDDHRNLFLLYGGEDGKGKALGDAWMYESSTWTKLLPATSPKARSEAAFAFDPRRARALMFGGKSVTTVQTTAWHLEHKLLVANRSKLFLQKGGVINFTVDGAPAFGNQFFVMLGSASGTTPGWTLPRPGQSPLRIPLNPDWYWAGVLGGKAFWLYPRLGLLDPWGRATVRFSLPPRTTIKGPFNLNHATLLIDLGRQSFTEVSDPVPLLLK